MAGNTVTVKIEGLDELERKLYDLPVKLSKLYMRRALLAGARIWRQEILSNAPRLTGWLRAQVAITTSLSSRYDQGTAHVGVRKKPDPGRHGKHVPSAANEAYWYELGTLRQPARPIIRPAFSAMSQAVLDAFAETLRAGLAEVFGK
jgi:HK97 gp10 family phage protein